MASSKAPTVKEYLAELPAERRTVLKKVRDTVVRSLPKGYEERMLYGMIGYVVPHKLYPDGYHCDPTKPVCYAGLAAQKNYYALYLMCVYQSKEQEKILRESFKKAGKKLDMGKSCIRFRSVDDLPLDAIGKVIASTPVDKFIAKYESVLKRR